MDLTPSLAHSGWNTPAALFFVTLSHANTWPFMATYTPGGKRLRRRRWQSRG